MFDLCNRFLGVFGEFCYSLNHFPFMQFRLCLHVAGRMLIHVNREHDLWYFVLEESMQLIFHEFLMTCVPEHMSLLMNWSPFDSLSSSGFADYCVVCSTC